MIFVYLVVFAMAVFATSAAFAFAWAASNGHFRGLEAQARSIFWDEPDVLAEFDQSEVKRGQ